LSTIPPISTTSGQQFHQYQLLLVNNSTNINYFSPQTIEHKQDYDTWHWNPGPGLEQVQKSELVEYLEKIQHHSNV
jgi:hypothetical protein